MDKIDFGREDIANDISSLLLLYNAHMMNWNTGVNRVSYHSSEE